MTLALFFIQNWSGYPPRQIEVRNIFRIEREGEVERYNASWERKYSLRKQRFQRRLLWHGSPKENFRGIIETGLNTGTRSHVFFSDFAGMSVGFCQKNHGMRGTRTPGMELMLLCEVAISNGTCNFDRLDERDANCVHSDLKGAVMLDVGVGDRLKFWANRYGGYCVGHNGQEIKHFECYVPNIDQVLMRYLFQFEVLSTEL